MALEERDNALVPLQEEIDEPIPVPETQFVVFRSKNPKMSFQCMLGADPPKITDGYGGWDVIDRPRRVGFMQYQSKKPLELTLAILFEGFQAYDEVENECRILEKMAFPADQPDPGRKPPPIIRIITAGVPHVGNDVDWVITNIDWGNAIRRNINGRRIRQEATVVLRRYEPFDKLQLSAARGARALKGRS